MRHIQLKTIRLKNHQELNVRWLQDIIADDPSIIGIGMSSSKQGENSSWSGAFRSSSSGC
tara:strand:- start:1228 stop:1407 length:180 start_codon:yes stop_codon:yes gene_type:complete